MEFRQGLDAGGGGAEQLSDTDCSDTREGNIL